MSLILIGMKIGLSQLARVSASYPSTAAVSVGGAGA